MQVIHFCHERQTLCFIYHWYC